MAAQKARENRGLKGEMDGAAGGDFDDLLGGEFAALDLSAEVSNVVYVGGCEVLWVNARPPRPPKGASGDERVRALRAVYSGSRHMIDILGAAAGTKSARVSASERPKRLASSNAITSTESPKRRSSRRRFLMN
jgi:hypothetical protein